MKRFCKNIAVLFLLFGFVLTARADWRLVGDTAELKIPVVLSPVKTSEGCVSGMRARPMYID